MDDYPDELRLIKDLLRKNPKGMSITEIARELGKNKHSVGRYLDVLRVSGQVEMRTYGMAKVFSLSRRVPISALLSHSPHELILWLDADLSIVQADENFLEFVELPRDEVIGKNIAHLAIPDIEVQDLVARIARAAGEEAESLGDIRVGGADERYFHSEIMATVFESGEQGYVVILVDITRRKHAEIALQESEKKYRELVENANSVILKMDRLGNITFFNEFAQRFFGYTLEEVLGRNVVGTIVPETESSGRDLREMIRDVCADPDAYKNNENENVTKDGRRVWIQWTNRAIFDEDGRAVGVLCIGNDITERKAAVDALNAERDFIHAVLDTVGAMVIVLDREGRILRFNRAAEDLTGFPEADVKGTPLWDIFVRAEDGDAVRKLFGQYIAGKPPGKGCTRYVDRNGVFHTVGWSNALLHDEDGAVSHVIVTGLVCPGQGQGEEDLNICQSRFDQ
jgi:PAS domain S-box-containing protein